MAKPSHTQGPWRFHPPFSGFSKITGPNGELIFGIAAGSADEKQPDDVCTANATLIASAPDGYELALKVAEHFADTDAPLGKMACDYLAKVAGEQ